ncbi:MAG: DUF2834 domain-containing protein [Cyanobacteriota bacterium]|nr:DUF2834 domain-containing protein [Cyanobacteriota bacterium]
MTPSSTPAAPAPAPSLAWLYLALAAAGAILPWLANWAFIRDTGQAFDLALFVRMANANPAAQSLSRDLAVGATAVTVWMVVESRRLGMRGLVWVLLSCVTVAFAFGAPLFLYLRERRLQELARLGSSLQQGTPPDPS